MSGTRMKEELVERLTSFLSRTLITVNFVKPSTKTYRFDVADAEKICWSLMRSLTTSFFYHRYRRDKSLIEYKAAIEMGNRYHAHILLRRPTGISAAKFEDQFRTVASKNEFAAKKLGVEFDDIHQRSIHLESATSSDHLCRYLLKQSRDIETCRFINEVKHWDLQPLPRLMLNFETLLKCFRSIDHRQEA